MKQRWIWLQILLAMVVLVLAGRLIFRTWNASDVSVASLHPRWSWILASALPVAFAYALLIESWRIALRAWGAQLAFADATRIFFVSNLGKWVPGKVWTITAMAAMSKQSGVSPVIAAAASLLLQVINVVAGLLVIVATGADAMGFSRSAYVTAAVLAVGLATAPIVFPHLARFAARITKRDIPFSEIPARAILSMAVGATLAWIAYGVAFRWFIAGILGGAGGNYGSAIAAYTASYLLGFLAFFAPGGIGVRETSLTGLLIALGLATAPQAAIVAVTSRIWLTILESLPGVAYLLAGRARSADSPPT